MTVGEDDILGRIMMCFKKHIPRILQTPPFSNPRPLLT